MHKNRTKMKFLVVIISLCISSLCYAIDTNCGIIDKETMGDLRTQVPWMAIIYKKNADNCTWQFWKTGSIIGPSTIIMSGRHFWNISYTGENKGLFPFKASDFLVGVGLLSSDIRDADFYSHFPNVAYITPHSKSSQTYTSFDVCLVQLKTPLKFTKYVRPVCIGDRNFNNPILSFSTIVNSPALKVGFDSDGGFERLNKNPVVLDSYPLDSNCSIELKRKTSLKKILHGDLLVKKCVNFDEGLAFKQSGRWYLSSVAVGGFRPSDKSVEEWYFFSPLDKQLLSWVQDSMQCSPGDITCYKKQCKDSCKLQDECTPLSEPIDNWCTSTCDETGMLLSEKVNSSDYVFPNSISSATNNIELTPILAPSVATTVAPIVSTKAVKSGPTIESTTVRYTITTNPELLVSVNSSAKPEAIVSTPSSSSDRYQSAPYYSDDVTNQIKKLSDTCKMLRLFSINFPICSSVNENVEKTLNRVARS